jgi:putative endonuclease
MNNTRSRQQARKRGLRAEALCAWLLRLQGYRIMDRNWRVPVGEVDIIARRRQVLAFVEVKTRDTEDAAREAVSLKQRQRIENAARAYLANHPECANLHVRFDVMAVAPWRWPAHIQAAWGMD